MSGDLVGQRQETVTPRHFFRNELDRLAVDDYFGKIDAFLAKCPADDIAYDRLGGKAELHQDLTQVFFVLSLFDKCDADLIGAHYPFINQQLSKAGYLLGGAHCSAGIGSVG